MAVKVAAETIGQPGYRTIPSETPYNIPGYSKSSWPETRQRKAQQAISKEARLNIQATYAKHLSKEIAKRRTKYMSHEIAKQRNSNNRGANESLPHALQQQLRHASSSSHQGKDDQPKLSHLTASGEAHMVDISGKIPTKRSATATTVLLFSHHQTYGALLAARLRKGDAVSVARIAGIQAAKKTADLIPLAHPGLSITGASVQLEPFVGDKLPHPFTRKTLGLKQYLQGGVAITATVSCDGKTGVEMEAMTSASVAGLTMYDMLKAVDKAMVLTATRVTAKSGGKSGDWKWDPSYNKIVKTDSAAENDALEHGHELVQAQKVQDCVRQKQLEIDVGVSPPQVSGNNLPRSEGSGQATSDQGSIQAKTLSWADKNAQRRIRKKAMKHAAKSTVAAGQESLLSPVTQAMQQDGQAAQEMNPLVKALDTSIGETDQHHAAISGETVYKRGRVDSEDFMQGRQERYAHYLEARGSVLTDQGPGRG